MSINVKISPVLARYTKNHLEATVTGANVRECLECLVEQFPKLQNPLFDKNGQLKSYLTIYINQEKTSSDILSKPVTNKDTLFIIQLLAGG
jgi:hypothetical protein